MTSNGVSGPIDTSPSDSAFLGGGGRFIGGGRLATGLEVVAMDCVSLLRAESVLALGCVVVVVGCDTPTPTSALLGPCLPVGPDGLLAGGGLFGMLPGGPGAGFCSCFLSRLSSDWLVLSSESAL